MSSTTGLARAGTTIWLLRNSGYQSALSRCGAGQVAERSMKDGIERGVRNLKIIEMGLLQVAKAIADGKVKPTVSDLDRLIRLEEFLREERKAGEQTKFIIEWRDASNPSEGQDKEAGEPSTG
ncbi:MAG: hypothetical protein V1694_06460 [Candidatus Eisenbacteria bacterium]